MGIGYGSRHPPIFLLWVPLVVTRLVLPSRLGSLGRIVCRFATRNSSLLQAWQDGFRDLQEPGRIMLDDLMAEVGEDK